MFLNRSMDMYEKKIILRLIQIIKNAFERHWKTAKIFFHSLKNVLFCSNETIKKLSLIIVIHERKKKD